MLFSPRLLRCTSLFFALAPCYIGATNLKHGRILPALLEECQVDCDVDEDCAGVLICADAHKAELAANGWDERKGWCEKKWRNSPDKLAALGESNEEVCLYPRILKQKKLGECEADCNHDYDCEGVLICADKHSEELVESGWDEHKGWCEKKWRNSPEKLEAMGAPDAGVCLYPRILRKEKLGECEADCNHDYDCEGRLICADKHTEELAEYGWDTRKGYCEKKYTNMPETLENLGGPDEGVCLYPRILGQNNLGECEADCDHDYDCEGELLCADKHKDQLESLGFDPRKAYCAADVGGPKDEVCFQPWALSI